MTIKNTIKYDLIKPKKIIVIVYISVALIVSAAIVEAGTIFSNLQFKVEEKSMWGTGAGFNFHKADFIGIQWDKTVSIGPTLGFELNGNTSGKMGLEYDFSLSTGTVDINFPVETKISFPDQVRPSDTITLSSSFLNLSGAIMKTFSPQATAKMELPFKLAANANGSIDPPFLDPIPFTLIPSIDLDKTYTFFNLGTGNTSFSKSFGAFGSIEAHIPVINTTGSLSGGKFSSEGSDDFINLSLDVDKVVSTLIPQVPPLGGELAIPNPFDSKEEVASISYDLLDLKAKLDTGFSQDFEFTPTLKVKYEIEGGQEFIVDAGDSINFSVPNGAGDKIEVSTTYFLENLFKNDTDLILTPGIDLSVLSGTATVFGFDLLDFGPVYNNGIATPIPIDIFSNQFSIDGFQTFQNAFTISVVPTPEPSTWVLVFFGLIGIMGIKKRLS